MSDFAPEKDRSNEAPKKESDSGNKLLSSISMEERAALNNQNAGKDNQSAAALPGLQLGVASPFPLRTIEVPADPHLDSKSWQHKLEYKKGVPGEYLPRFTPHTGSPDPRVEAALATIKTDDIKRQLDQISGNTDVVIDGKTTRIESRSTHGHGYEQALELFKDKFQKDGYQVVLDTYTRNGETLHNLRAIKVGTTKPNEIVMIGGHIDSTAGDTWEDEPKAPGADDDGSGSVAVAEIAHAYKNLPLDRTVVFSLFSGEEQGLWGSRAMAELYKQSQNNVRGDLDKAGVSGANNSKIIAMYQVDMIGYAPDSNTIESHDTANKPGPHALTDLLNSKVQQYNLDLKVYGAHNDELNDRSDHYNFARMGIPAVLVMEPYDTAKTENPHYHSTHDVVANMNLPYVTNVTKMVAAAGIELAGLPLQNASKLSIKEQATQIMPLQTRIKY